MASDISIVTGAASGIGLACAERLLAKGNSVVLVDANEQQLDALDSRLASSVDRQRWLTLRLDVRSESDMERMAQQTVSRFGRIDHLVASAGILRVGGALRAIADTTMEEWRRIIDTNLTGLFLSNRAVLPAMRAQKKGDIINISSVSGKQGRAYDGPYCASKFGIIGLSESLAEEVSAFGIRVQTILPDAVDTPLWSQNGAIGIRAENTLPPARVAEFVSFMLDLPMDTFLLNPVITPFKSRRRRRKKSTDETAATGDAGQEPDSRGG